MKLFKNRTGIDLQIKQANKESIINFATLLIFLNPEK
jgi:hypothetical protein